MLQLKNTTPFKAAFAKLPNANGIDTIYLVATATFKLWPRIELDEVQLSPILADKYFDETRASSLRYPAELHLGKLSTDVIVVGSARAPGGRPVADLTVGIQIARHEHALRVFGDRECRAAGSSPPAPFVEMPLVYERAFGGVLRRDGSPDLVEDRNPLGVGLGVTHRCALRGDPLPNIEDPRQLLNEGVAPTPAGVAAIPPAWLPRRSYAGTYDERWQRTRAPYLPEDFQSRYFNAAAPRLVMDRYLQGGEPLLLVGMRETGPLTATLPACALRTAFVLRGEVHERPNQLQTVLIEPDDNRLRLTFHAEFACDKAVLDVERIEVSLQRLELEKAFA